MRSFLGTLNAGQLAKPKNKLLNKIPVFRRRKITVSKNER